MIHIDLVQPDVSLRIYDKENGLYECRLYDEKILDGEELLIFFTPEELIKLLASPIKHRYKQINGLDRL